MANANYSASAVGTTVEGACPWFFELITCSICYHPYEETFRAGSDRFWMTECGHFLCDKHDHQPGICTYCKFSPVSTHKVNASMDPDLLYWFKTPISALESATRTINFQQAEVSRLVSHLREQISKQNKALKKAAQQIRANETTAAELENARREIISLKRELGKLPTTGQGGTNTNGNSFKSPAVMRPVARQQTSSESSRQFLMTGALSGANRLGDDRVNLQMTNDGFGAENLAERDRMTGTRTQADLPLRVQQGPIQHDSIQNYPDSRIPSLSSTNDAGGVIISDRTKGMGSFKHPDVLGLSPRKRALPDLEVEEPLPSKRKHFSQQSTQGNQLYTPNPPNTANSSRVTLPLEPLNNSRSYTARNHVAARMSADPERRQGTFPPQSYLRNRGERSNPESGSDDERNVSRTSSRASVRDRLQQFKFDAIAAGHSSAALQAHGGANNPNLNRPSTAMQLEPIRYVAQDQSYPSPRPQSAIDRPTHTMIPYIGPLATLRQSTPRKQIDGGISPGESSASANHSRFLPQSRPSL